MNIKPNDFYKKMGEWCNSNIVALFYDITAYILSAVKMENTDDVFYDFNPYGKEMNMLVLGKEDSVQIEIRPEGIPNGDAIMYVRYYLRIRERETTYQLRRNGVCVCDDCQWQISSKSFTLEKYVGCKTLNHFDVIKAIMKSHVNKALDHFYDK